MGQRERTWADNMFQSPIPYCDKGLRCSSGSSLYAALSRLSGNVGAGLWVLESGQVKIREQSGVPGSRWSTHIPNKSFGTTLYIKLP